MDFLMVREKLLSDIGAGFTKWVGKIAWPTTGNALNGACGLYYLVQALLVCVDGVKGATLITGQIGMIVIPAVVFYGNQAIRIGLTPPVMADPAPSEQ